MHGAAQADVLRPPGGKPWRGSAGHPAFELHLRPALAERRFRTAPGTKLGSLPREGDAAFEIDGIDAGGRTGWNVVIIGVAEEMTSPGETRRLDKLGLEVWATGERSHWVRIRARTVSGRRIAAVARR